MKEDEEKYSFLDYFVVIIVFSFIIYGGYKVMIPEDYSQVYKVIKEDIANIKK